MRVEVGWGVGSWGCDGVLEKGMERRKPCMADER